LGDGMDWMMRNRPSVLAQLISRIFPSEARSARGVQVVPQLESRAGSRLRIFLIYCRGSAESVNTTMTSLRANHHSSLCQTRRMVVSWNTAMWCAGSLGGMILVILRPKTVILYSSLCWFNRYFLPGRWQFWMRCNPSSGLWRLTFMRA